jgi:hypothetical protein
MTRKDVNNVFATIRLIFVTYQQIVVNWDADLNNYKIFLNVESKNPFNKMFKLRFPNI